jgi:hypothetical protein
LISGRAWGVSTSTAPHGLLLRDGIRGQSWEQASASREGDITALRGVAFIRCPKCHAEHPWSAKIRISLGIQYSRPFREKSLLSFQAYMGFDIPPFPRASSSSTELRHIWRDVSISECTRQQLRGQPVIVMQAVQHLGRHKSSARWLWPSQHWIRIRYPVHSLMHAAVVVPTYGFGEYTPKMPLIPDQHLVETLPANRPYQPLEVRRRVGCAIRNRYPPDAHLLPEPLIVCRSTRHPFPCVLNS